MFPLLNTFYGVATWLLGPAFPAILGVSYWLTAAAATGFYCEGGGEPLRKLASGAPLLGAAPILTLPGMT
jgi:hypothetical protein